MSPTWNEGDHPRDGQGQFTHASVGSWLKEAVRYLNDRGLKRGDMRPPGFEAAVARSEHLWSIPDRGKGVERTDEEQAELDELEAAFETYRARLGATERDPRSNKLQYVDGFGRKYDAYGRHVGEAFWLEGSGRQDRRRTVDTKGDRRSRKMEDWTSTPDDRERRSVSDGGKIGRRLEGAPEAFIKDMRRAQARTRAESGRTPVRRTPRGTRVEGWMVEADKRIGARRG